MNEKLNALLAVRSNTRVVLASALIERNAECEALRAELSLLRSKLPTHGVTVQHMGQRVIKRYYGSAPQL